MSDGHLRITKKHESRMAEAKLMRQKIEKMRRTSVMAKPTTNSTFAELHAARQKTLEPVYDIEEATPKENDGPAYLKQTKAHSQREQSNQQLRTKIDERNIDQSPRQQSDEQRQNSGLKRQQQTQSPREEPRQTDDSAGDHTRFTKAMEQRKADVIEQRQAILARKKMSIICKPSEMKSFLQLHEAKKEKSAVAGPSPRNQAAQGGGASESMITVTNAHNSRAAAAQAQREAIDKRRRMSVLAAPGAAKTFEDLYISKKNADEKEKAASPRPKTSGSPSSVDRTTNAHLQRAEMATNQREAIQQRKKMSIMVKPGEQRTFMESYMEKKGKESNANNNKANPPPASNGNEADEDGGSNGVARLTKAQIMRKEQADAQREAIDGRRKMSVFSKPTPNKQFEDLHKQKIANLQKQQPVSIPKTLP